MGKEMTAIEDEIFGKLPEVEPTDPKADVVTFCTNIEAELRLSKVCELVALGGGVEAVYAYALKYWNMPTKSWVREKYYRPAKALLNEMAEMNRTKAMSQWYIVFNKSISLAYAQKNLPVLRRLNRDWAEMHRLLPSYQIDMNLNKGGDMSEDEFVQGLKLAQYKIVEPDSEESLELEDLVDDNERRHDAPEATGGVDGQSEAGGTEGQA